MNCSKRAFETKDEANNRLVEIRFEIMLGIAKPNLTGKLLRVYKCVYCSKFHLTSKTKRQYEKNMKRKKGDILASTERRIEKAIQFFAKRKGWNLNDLI